jgi:16S rRNA (cytosine967-C5)-methyltransferase
VRPGAAPREAALAILRAVRSGATFDQALDQALPTLDPLDRRLAHEIAAGVLRERTSLDRTIRGVLTHPKRRLPTDIHDVLRIGAYQLRYLDRVPPHAAVDSGVELAKSAGNGSVGLVNAVLRRLAAQTEGSEDEQTDLATRYSHPGWLVDRWIGQFGAERSERLLASNNCRPPLTIQPARWDGRRLMRALERAGVRARVLPEDRGIILEGIRSVSAIPGFADGAFVVQDQAQRRLLAFAGIPDGATVWDACAAPGGKAAVLGRSCHVIATDSSRRRVHRLLETVRRAAPSVTVLPADAARPPWRDETFDWVLIDAPCSGTGAMARHPDARWRLAPKSIATAVERQRAILEATSATVRQGGTLVYLTCSLEVEENHQQIDRFLDRHPEFSRGREDLVQFPSEGSDGGYGACVTRTGREG